MYRIIGADGREYGPISADLLRQWIAEGRANASTQALVEGAPEWKPLGSLPEFSLLFAAKAQPIAPPVLPTGTTFPPSTAFATTGLVLGIISICFCCCCYGLPFNVLGLIFSLVALGQIKGDPGRYGGKGMAIAGLVLCAVSIVLMILLVVLWALGASLDQTTHHVYRL
jgi:succinate dehydrogenase/fumarate reductase cytochrome b subunit